MCQQPPAKIDRRLYFETGRSWKGQTIQGNILVSRETSHCFLLLLFLRDEISTASVTYFIDTYRRIGPKAAYKSPGCLILSLWDEESPT